MRIENFKSYEDLAEYIMDFAARGAYTVTILYYDGAVELMRELLKFSELAVSSIDVEPEEYGGYNREYYVSVAPDMDLCVERAYVDGKYLLTDADLTLVDGDAHSSSIIDINVAHCIEISVGESFDDELCDCDFCEEECLQRKVVCALEEVFEKSKIIDGEDGESASIEIYTKPIIDLILDK